MRLYYLNCLIVKISFTNFKFNKFENDFALKIVRFASKIEKLIL